jgi:hypothetical protein
MNLNKAGFRVLSTSLVGGFCLAYSAACHWFGFLSASKINRLELLFIFGAIFIVFSWQFLKYGSGIFLKEVSRPRFYLFLGASLVIAGVITLVVLPSSQNRLISSLISGNATLTASTRVLWIGLKLSDFICLAGLLLIVEIALSILAGRWKWLLPIISRWLAVFFPLGLLMFAGVVANLTISATGKLGTLNKLTLLPENGLIALDEGSNTYSENIRVYTILFKNYQGWTLVTPVDLVDKLDIDAGGRLKSWGRIGSIVTVNYPTELSDQEMKDLLALKNVNEENGSGLHYVAILEDDSARKICFRTHKETVFIVPVSLSPVCESR